MKPYFADDLVAVGAGLMAWLVARAIEVRYHYWHTIPVEEARKYELLLAARPKISPVLVSVLAEMGGATGWVLTVKNEGEAARFRAQIEIRGPRAVKSRVVNGSWLNPPSEDAEILGGQQRQLILVKTSVSRIGVRGADAAICFFRDGRTLDERFVSWLDAYDVAEDGTETPCPAEEGEVTVTISSEPPMAAPYRETFRVTPFLIEVKADE